MNEQEIDDMKRRMARLADDVDILKRLVELQGNRITELERSLHELDPKYYNRHGQT